MGSKHLYLALCHFWLLSVVAHQGVVDLLPDLAVLRLLGHGGYPDSLRLEEPHVLAIIGEVEDRIIPVSVDGYVVVC